MGANAIVAALKINTTLQKLNLSTIEESNLLLIALALQSNKNTKLTNLTIEKNNIPTNVIANGIDSLVSLLKNQQKRNVELFSQTNNKNNYIMIISIILLLVIIAILTIILLK